MFASGTTPAAGLLRGRRRQSLMVASRRLLRSSEKRRRQYKLWRDAQEMGPGGSDDILAENYDGDDYGIEMSSKSEQTLVEIPISKRRQVAINAEQDDDALQYSGEEETEDATGELQMQPPVEFSQGHFMPLKRFQRFKTDGEADSPSPKRDRTSSDYASSLNRISQLQFHHVAEASTQRKAQYFQGRIQMAHSSSSSLLMSSKKNHHHQQEHLEIDFFDDDLEQNTMGYICSSPYCSNEAPSRGRGKGRRGGSGRNMPRPNEPKRGGAYCREICDNENAGYMPPTSSTRNRAQSVSRVSFAEPGNKSEKMAKPSASMRFIDESPTASPIFVRRKTSRRKMTSCRVEPVVETSAITLKRPRYYGSMDRSSDRIEEVVMPRRSPSPPELIALGNLAASAPSLNSPTLSDGETMCLLAETSVAKEAFHTPSASPWQRSNSYHANLPHTPGGSVKFPKIKPAPTAEYSKMPREQQSIQSISEKVPLIIANRSADNSSGSTGTGIMHRGATVTTPDDDGMSQIITLNSLIKKSPSHSAPTPPGHHSDSSQKSPLIRAQSSANAASKKLAKQASDSSVCQPSPGKGIRPRRSTSPSAVPSNILAGLRRLRPIVMRTVPSEREQQCAEHKCPPGQCRFIRINVSGLLFEICASYLDRHPKTLLGDKTLMAKYWEPRRKEYFFDRHRPSFEGIFAFLKYGDLPRKPDGVPDDVFLDELYFYRIEDDIIDAWKTSRGIPIFEPQKYVLKKEDHFFRRLWYMFEFPAHSRMSYALNIISVIAAIVAVCCLIFESLPNVSTSHCLEGNRPNFNDKFFIIETSCTAWFTLELLFRIIGAPTWRFLVNYQTCIDIAANTPYYVILGSVLYSMDCSGAKASASTGFLRIFRLFSVFKLSDRSGAFALIMNTFKASTRVLTLFFLALAVCVVLFGSFIYIIEAETDAPQSEFQSIADGFWWAVITMTTVGYGDLIPRTVAGKIVGSCCAIVGVITLSMPIPILTENFNKFYKQMKKHKSMIQS